MNIQDNNNNLIQPVQNVNNNQQNLPNNPVNNINQLGIQILQNNPPVNIIFAPVQQGNPPLNIWNLNQQILGLKPANE